MTREDALSIKDDKFIMCDWGTSGDPNKPGIYKGDFSLVEARGDMKGDMEITTSGPYYGITYTWEYVDGLFYLDHYLLPEAQPYEKGLWPSGCGDSLHY